MHINSLSISLKSKDIKSNLSVNIYNVLFLSKNYTVSNFNLELNLYPSFNVSLQLFLEDTAS